MVINNVINGDLWLFYMVYGCIWVNYNDLTATKPWNNG